LRAIDIARGQRTRTFELRAALSLATLYKEAGRKQAAHAIIESALTNFDHRPELSEFAEAERLLTLLNGEVTERCETDEVAQRFTSDLLASIQRNA
jgi:hypothetical protein